MSDPLSIKVKAVLFTSLALLVSLGIASGFRWAQGGEAATLAQNDSPALVTNEAAVASPAATAPINNATLAEVNRAFVAIAESMTPAVVSIDTRGQPHQTMRGNPFEDLFRQFRQQEPEELPFDVPLGRGSGFIVSEDGYVLTNNHVVAIADQIEVGLSDGRSFPAELVGRDPTTDVALLKIEGEDLPTVNLGNSDAAKVGELVMAIGNPGTEFASALPFTVTTGIISGKGRSLGIIQRAAGGSEYAIEDLIQTDAVINPGNSGGPLVNYRGEVIGINTAIASVTGYYQGYGFAIPITLASDVMEDLIEYGRVRRAALYVSVTPVSRADAIAYDLPNPWGAVVQGFPEDSPARKAGIERNDVIVAVDGKPIRRVGQLQSVIASYEPGDRVEVTVVRYGERHTVEVRLAEADVPQPESPTVASERPSNLLIGLQVRNLTPELAEQAGFESSEDLEGVVVTDVVRFGPAAMAGLGRRWVIREVNGERIRNVDDFDSALAEVKRGDVVSIDAVIVDADGDRVERTFNIEVPRR